MLVMTVVKMVVRNDAFKDVKAEKILSFFSLYSCIYNDCFNGVFNGVFNGEWSNEIYNRGFILPTYPELNSDDIDYIASICNKY